MFANNVAATIKAAGKILKEKNETFFLPFGSEYSIYLKNLNPVRIAVRISVDGQDLGDGTEFIVQPNASLEVERFLKNANLEQGHRLKFIERSDKIENHRGIKIDDGLIRIEFQKEKVAPKVETVIKKTIHEHVHHDHWHGPYYYGGCFSQSYYPLIGSANIQYSNSAGASYTATTSNAEGSVKANSMSFNAGSDVANAASVKPSANLLRSANVRMRKLVNPPVMDSLDYTEANDAGITVPGSLSNQQFHVVSSFPVEDEKHVIILKLLGETGKGKVVKQAVTVKTAQVCQTCGTRNRGKFASFCRDCGTALEIVA